MPRDWRDWKRRLLMLNRGVAGPDDSGFRARIDAEIEAGWGRLDCKRLETAESAESVKSPEEHEDPRDQVESSEEAT